MWQTHRGAASQPAGKIPELKVFVAQALLPMLRCLHLAYVHSHEWLCHRSHPDSSFPPNVVASQLVKGAHVMAKKDKLAEVSRKIGTALGKADKQAHVHVRKLAAANKITKQELQDISKQVDALKKQLAKSTDRLKKALSS